MNVTQIQVNADEVWEVRINDKCECSIVDSEGRERVRANGHTMTAVHFAGFLAEVPFASTEVVDKALRRSAEDFMELSE